jgi:hypothetical protein
MLVRYGWTSGSLSQRNSANMLAPVGLLGLIGVQQLCQRRVLMRRVQTVGSHMPATISASSSPGHGGIVIAIAANGPSGAARN